ncbi:hypothetical protein [Actinophytocola xanthii]|uniref:NERD domain-containing protein n=1 Tax=Actinophytocola xanthii TaxID=1912961 RepID=A0A1Q8CQD0_9PSEU|nr:hypothetical protein [Actinophytocola xanthii]OLF16555.1 hypothetical protein BU204_15985 [Actinophytocola xanthii]
MRLVRLSEESSKVGADVRAALASWGRGDTVVGGVALVGYRPGEGSRRLDAVVVLPRGVLVVAGVDLPDPAMRLDAPLTGQWRTDGWPLSRPDGLVNPAAEVTESIEEATHLLHRAVRDQAGVEPVPVGAVIAVGPYVAEVHQPAEDLERGVRVLHPEPATLLTAARELATRPRPCTAEQARALLEALEPENPALAALDLTAEGFAATAEAATSVTAPSGTGTSKTGTAKARTSEGGTTAKPPAPASAKATSRARPGSLRWLPVSAAVLVAVLLLGGIVYAVATSGDEDDAADASPTTTTQSNEVEIGGRTFTPKGTVSDTDCAAHAYGDVQVWLERNRCGQLVRMRYESTSGERRAALLVAVLRFPETALAGELKAVADLPGSGAITDPSTEDQPWPGEVKPFFESAAYASGREGNSLKLVQAVWVGAPSTPEDPDLVRLATLALDIPAPT